MVVVMGLEVAVEGALVSCCSALCKWYTRLSVSVVEGVNGVSIPYCAGWC